MAGLIPKPAPLPQWRSFKDYLTYLNLNEPIIGLGDLVQEQDFITTDGRSLLRYRCRLCTVQMDHFDMATHVVGRRHRQKYLERYRPDLVTWEKTSEKQAGVVARAKAAIVEKQEGWGNPVPLIRSEKGRSLKNRSYDGAEQVRPSYLQGSASSEQNQREQGSYSRSYMEGDNYGKPSDYHEDDLYDQPYGDDVSRHPSSSRDNRYNQSYRDDVSDHPSGSREDRYDEPYSQDSRQRGSNQIRDYMERPYLEDDMNIGSFPDDGADERRYTDKSVSQSYQDEWFPEKNPSGGPYKIKEGDDYYRGSISENVFGESGLDYQDSGRMQGLMYHGSGPSMDERQRENRNLPYTETGRECFKDMDETGRGLRRQRYYPTEDDGPSKRKRKSRFSHASPVEMDLARKSQIVEMISKYKQKGRSSLMKNQASGNNMDSAVTPRMENVLEVLNDIQIDNVQEANYLKDKLCILLKEFQANKVQGAQSQVSQPSADFTGSYYGGNKMDQRRDVPEPRRLDDQGFQEHSRYDRDLQGPRDYFHTRHVEEDPKSLRQNRGPEEPGYQWDPYREGAAGRSEERMARHQDDRRGYREGARTSRPLREEERMYAEEHRYQQDYRSGGDLYDPFEPSSSPPLEAGSSTLDKLASTLLELVARKTI